MKAIRIVLTSIFLFSAIQAYSEVIISAPEDGATVSSPVMLSASSTSNKYHHATLTVYVNDNLVLQQQSDVVQIPLTVSAGKNVITVVAQSYSHSSSASVTVNVAAQAPVSSPSDAGGISVAAQISDDMTGGNEGAPHGVPLSYDWAVGPTHGLENAAPSGWKAATAWGLVYQAAEGNMATNTRINIRNVQFYLLQKSTNKWLLLQNTNSPDGANYIEDFSTDATEPADERTEPDGSLSVIPGSGYTFHFYPRERAPISPDDIAGIVTLFEARLIVGNTSKPDDRALARYLAGSGGDYWPDVVGGMAPGQTVAPLIAGGKLKYVQTYWRSYAMTTLAASQLASNPPPVNLDNVQQ